MIRYFLVLFAVAAVATVLLVTRVDSVTFALAMLAAGRAGRWVLDRPGSRCRGPPAHSRARRPPRPDGAPHPPTTSPIPLTPVPSGIDGPLSGKASGFAASGARSEENPMTGGRTTCCNRPVFELPATDQLAFNDEAVTCDPVPEPDTPDYELLAKLIAEITHVTATHDMWGYSAVRDGRTYAIKVCDVTDLPATKCICGTSTQDLGCPIHGVQVR